MLAFSIDIGYMALVKTDLQHVADAAALAGAEQLQNLFVQYNLPLQARQWEIRNQAMARTPGGPMDTAKRFASYNRAGNVNIQVLDSDVTFGFTDANGNYTSPYSGFPNTISVTARRDSSANGSLPLFFGQVLGQGSKDLTATARATLYIGDVSSLKVIPGVDAHILPVALDVNFWKTFYATGLSPDGTIHTAPNGYPQLQLYPYPGNTPGSFGLVDTGAPANNVPAFRNWISDGATPNDISYLLNNNLVPVSISSPRSWKVGPGLKSTLLTNFQDELGKPNLIPLFKAVNPDPNNYLAATGTGQNATYAIVGFVGVTITDANGSSGNLNISVQPYAVIDPTAVILNPTPAGTGQSSFGTSATTFISVKLTN
jgi:hypothetical protein